MPSRKRVQSSPPVGKMLLSATVAAMTAAACRSEFRACDAYVSAPLTSAAFTSSHRRALIPDVVPVPVSSTESGGCFLRLSPPRTRLGRIRCLGKVAVPTTLSISTAAGGADGDSEEVDLDGLMEMDIVTFVRRGGGGDGGDGDDETAAAESPVLELGAVQEDGTLAPLCAWTMDSAFANSDGEADESVEFLVNEDLPTVGADEVRITRLLDEGAIGYGSRQVGGGKGPGNPHGEESEMLYYVDKGLIETMGVNVVLRPELEILW